MCWLFTNDDDCLGVPGRTAREPFASGLPTGFLRDPWAWSGTMATSLSNGYGIVLTAYEGLTGNKAYLGGIAQGY